MVAPLGVAFALDLNASCESSGAPRISYNWEFWPFKFLLTKARQSDVTEFQRKSEIPMFWKGIFKFAQWVPFANLVLCKWIWKKI